MSEQFPAGPRPFNPSGWSEFSIPILDSPRTQGTLPSRLTYEEVAALQPGEPVPDLAAMAYFETAEDFLAAAKNFEVRFRKPTSDKDLASAIYRRQESFQRFEYMYPEMVVALSGHLDQNKEKTRAQDYDTVTKGLLFHAYNIMTGLVAKNDTGIRGEHGRINKNFLLG